MRGKKNLCVAQVCGALAMYVACQEFSGKW